MPTELNAKARPVLRDIIVENGRSLVRDRARLRSFLLDLCPDCHAEIETILAAVDDGVPGELMKSAPGPSELAALASGLASRRGLSQANAEWAVNAWMFALDVKAKAAPPQAPPPDKKIAPPPAPAPAPEKKVAPPPPPPQPPAPAPKAPIALKREPDWAADRNRSEGWKRLLYSVFILFFWGGAGVWGMSKDAGTGAWGQVVFWGCVILALSALSGLYKVITGR